MIINEEIIQEAILSHAQRMSKGRHIRKHTHRLVHARMRAKRRIASNENLTQRARRHARNAVRKLVAGKLGAKYHELSPMQKAHIDKKVEHRKVLVGQLAKRMFHHVKRAEIERYKKMKQVKK